MNKISNFTTIDTIYGKWIVSRNAQYHAESFIKTGHPVCEEQSDLMIQVCKTLPEDFLFVDVGSNQGVVSIPLAYAFKNARFLAFEVQKKLFHALCGTIVLNEYDNLEVFNCGLGDSAKTLTIEKVNYNDSWDYGILSLVDQEKIKSKPHDTVEIHPLDYFELDRLDFIKIDVEGMELEVLEGGRSTIERYRPWAYIEFWNVDTGQLKSWFDSKDYTIYQFDGGNILCCPNEKLSQSNLNFNLTKW